MTGTVAALSSSIPQDALIRLLSPLNAEIFKEFIHRCADEVCGRKGPSEETFCSPCSWTSSQFQQAVSGVKVFLTECVLHKRDRDEIAKRLLLSENQINAFVNCITIRRDELQLSILDYFQNTNSEVLSDHDWKVKWIMGSSSLSSLQETLLELDLITVKGNIVLCEDTPPQRNRIRIELTRDNVNTLISTLEKAQES